MSAAGVKSPFPIAAAKVLLDCRVYAKHVYATSSGCFAAAYYLCDWRSRVSIEDIVRIMPRGKLRPNVPWWRSVFCCARNTHRRRHLGSERDIRKRMAQDPATYKGDGKWTDRGIDLARDRSLLFFEQLVRSTPHFMDRIRGRLTIAVCRLARGRTEYIDRWDDVDDFMKCVYAASFIPTMAGGWCGERWRGATYADGGLLTIHPIKDRHTVCITTLPFSDRPHSLAARLKGRQFKDGMGEISWNYGDRGSARVLRRHHYYQLWARGERRARQYVRACLVKQRRHSRRSAYGDNSDDDDSGDGSETDLGSESSSDDDDDDDNPR